MTGFQWCIAVGIGFLGLTALTHSLAGEKYLIGPMVRRRGNVVLEHPLGRTVLRFAWHLTSLMWLMMAIVLYQIGFGSGALEMVILAVFGVGFVVAGVFDLIVSSGRHLGWPMLTGTGVFLLLGLWIGKGSLL